jgi:hypothetical protein
MYHMHNPPCPRQGFDSAGKCPIHMIHADWRQYALQPMKLLTLQNKRLIATSLSLLSKQLAFPQHAEMVC